MKKKELDDYFYRRGKRTLEEAIRSFTTANRVNPSKTDMFLEGCCHPAAFVEMRDLACAQNVPSEISQMALEALGNVNDRHAAYALIAITIDPQNAIELQLKSQELLVKHAERGSAEAWEHFAITSKDSNLPIPLRQHANEVMGSDQTAQNDKSRTSAVLIVSHREAKQNLAEKLFHQVVSNPYYPVYHRDAYETGLNNGWNPRAIRGKVLDAVIADFKEVNGWTYHDHGSVGEFRQGREAREFLCSAEAYNAIQQVASSPFIEDSVAVSAIESLGYTVCKEEPDELACTLLVGLADDIHLSDIRRVASHEQLLFNYRGQSLVAAEYAEKTFRNSTLPTGFDLANKKFLEVISKGMSPALLEHLAKSSVSSISERAKSEINRLSTADSRLLAQDVYVLEKFVADRVKHIELDMDHDADVLEKQRLVKMAKGPRYRINDHINNPRYYSDVIKTRIKNSRKSIDMLRKRPVFDFAVDEIYAYSVLTGRKREFSEVAATSMEFAELATSLPVIRYESTVRNAATENAQRVLLNEELDSRTIEYAAFVFSWGMQIESNEAAKEAKTILDYLQQLSDGGLTEVKAGLLSRLADESKSSNNKSRKR